MADDEQRAVLRYSTLFCAVESEKTWPFEFADCPLPYPFDAPRPDRLD